MTAYNEYTDTALLDLLPEDNQQAFNTIYSRHWETMYKAAFFILKDADACKDIVQDIFIWMWEHRHSLHVVNLNAYLRAAVKFKVANYIRSGNIRESFFNQLVGLRFSLQSSSEDLIEFKQLKEIILQAISDLPDRCREIYQLSRDGELTNQEIADRLQISVKTVENQMTIALKRLRKNAEPHLTTATSILLLYLSSHLH